MKILFLVRHGINAKTIAKVGHAGETISKTADSGKFDLVVMGSVATQVLAHCKVPVLPVR
jgi:nucleotide-binding universal stress UspA family protein